MPYFSLNKHQIQDIFSENVSYTSGPIQCLATKTTLPIHFAVAVSKQIAKKSEKTKIKRQIRSLVLTNASAWNNWNVVFVIYKNYFQYSYSEINQHLNHLLNFLNEQNKP